MSGGPRWSRGWSWQGQRANLRGDEKAGARPEEDCGESGDEQGPEKRGPSIFIELSSGSASEACLETNRRCRRRKRRPSSAPAVERTTLSVSSWPDYARTARTERGARGEFLGTRRGTSEEKIGEIDADDRRMSPTADQRATRDARVSRGRDC